MVEVLAALSLGLMSSLHCILMCGPLALAIPLGNLSIPLRPWARVVFVVGRWTIYALMGAVVGALGLPISWLGFQDIWLWILAAGLFAFVALWNKDFLVSIRQRLQKISRQIIDTQPISGFFTLGMANGLLPCGMVYAALALSVASGSAFWGFLVMLAFGFANSWWHLILIFGWRIPKLNLPQLAFLNSNRVTIAILTFALLFRLLHNLEHTHLQTHTNQSTPIEKAVCRKQP